MAVRPVCFMVMPFGRKSTQADPGKGAAEIDFNALWDKAFFPLLTELGYQAVRADQETNALIVNEMLERLYFSDLILADLTTPNGNVYYEIGVRHAACRAGCVLVAADWSKPLFDVAQMRSLRYPLPNGDIDDVSARAVRNALRPSIEKMRNGLSPVFEVPGYPGPVDRAHATGVRDQLASLAAFQAELRALRAMPVDMRRRETKDLLAKYAGGPAVYVVAVGLVRALVSAVDEDDGWQDVLDYNRNARPRDPLGPLCARAARACAREARPAEGGDCGAPRPDRGRRRQLGAAGAARRALQGVLATSLIRTTPRVGTRGAGRRVRGALRPLRRPSGTPVARPGPAGRCPGAAARC